MRRAEPTMTLRTCVSPTCASASWMRCRAGRAEQGRLHCCSSWCRTAGQARLGIAGWRRPTQSTLPHGSCCPAAQSRAAPPPCGPSPAPHLLPLIWRVVGRAAQARRVGQRLLHRQVGVQQVVLRTGGAESAPSVVLSPSCWLAVPPRRAGAQHPERGAGAAVGQPAGTLLLPPRLPGS